MDRKGGCVISVAVFKTCDGEQNTLAKRMVISRSLPCSVENDLSCDTSLAKISKLFVKLKKKSSDLTSEVSCLILLILAVFHAAKRDTNVVPMTCKNKKG